MGYRDITDGSSSGVWWVMSSKRLMELLRRAHAGEDPEMLHLTEYANADVEHTDGDAS